MKTIRRNFLLLAFAAGALFLIGNNVFAGEDPNESEDPGENWSWKDCRYAEGGQGFSFPFWRRECSTCQIKFMSSPGGNGKCYG